MSEGERKEGLHIGDVVALLHHEADFKNSFSRFPDDAINGWTAAKQSHRGKKGTVVEIYDDRTVSLIFSDGVQLDFPIETLSLNLGSAEQMPVKPLEEYDGNIPVSVHEHTMEAVPGVSYYWGCNGIFLDGGCKSGATDAFNAAEGRHKCSAGCDYDLCKQCVQAYLGSVGSNVVATSMDQIGHMTVVHGHHVIEAYTRAPWRCFGAGLTGGCKNGYPDEVINLGKSTRYICRDYRCEGFDLCLACFDAYEIIETRQVSNDEGRPTNPQYDTNHGLCTRHYCGHSVGQEGYQNACGSCDGYCGPDSGCQCRSCYRLDSKPKISKHMLSRALKKNTKEWKRSKIMIVGEGRAGKTALSNSIIGKEYQNTESTIGINQLTCNVNYTALGAGSWGEFKKPDREYEAAIAQNVIEEKRKKLATKGKVSTKKTIDVAHLSTEESKRKVKDGADEIRNVAINRIEEEEEKKVSKAPGVDEEFVINCLADDLQMGSLVISIFDYGGQSIFNVIHHFFLTRYGVYCLVFNMEWLSEKDHQNQEQCLAYLRFWINSIVVHTWNEESQSAAPVVLVGTRKDKVCRPEDHEHIHLLLHKTFSSSIIWPFVLENRDAEGSNGKATLCFFAVDNTKSRFDPTMRDLMTTVETAMNESEYTHMQVPLTWLRALDKVSAMNSSYIPLDDFSRLCEVCGVKASDVVPLLFFLNGMGYLMWHNEPGLREMVILDPINFFVTPATIVICKHNPDETDANQHILDVHKQCSKRYHRKWQDLTRQGILHQELLAILWKDYREYIDTLLSLMIKFGLLVPLREGDSSSNPPAGESGKMGTTLSYLVPSLLTNVELDQQAWFEDNYYTSCFFVFTATPELEDSATITLTDLHECGFLPGGLFERIIGKAVDWCLKTSPVSSKFRLDCLYKDLVILRYGNQLFRLQAFPQHNCVRLDVVGKNPLVVYNRILDQIQHCIVECMKALMCIPCVPFMDNTSSSAALKFDFSSPSFMLIPLARVRESVQNFSVLNRKGGRPLFDAVKAKRLYSEWLQMHELLDQYDVFISYRWGPYDKLLAHSIFDMCSNFNIGANNRAIEVFLDDMRLQSGRKYQDDFIKSLKGSSVVMPVVTFDALERMLCHNADVVDNVLMEWIFALECIRSGNSRVENIFPIISGQRDKLTGNSTDLFRSPVLNMLPTIHPSATVNAVEKGMRSVGMQPNENLQHSSIHSIVHELLTYMGISLDSQDVGINAAFNNNSEAIANGIMKILNILNQEEDKNSLPNALACESTPPEVEAVSDTIPTAASTDGRTLAQVVQAIRNEFQLSSDEKVAFVLQHAMEQLAIEGECAKLHSVKDKAYYIANTLGI